MKTNKMHIMLMLPFFTAALCGCSGNTSTPREEIDLSGYTLFSANVESISFTDGSALDQNWKDGDRIGVFGSEAGNNAEYYLRKSSAGQSEATFYGELVKGSIVAYKPFAEGVSLIAGKIPVEIGKNQTYIQGSSFSDVLSGACERLTASLDNEKLHFLYPAGILAIRFVFDETTDIDALKLTCKSGISGSMLVGEDGVAEPAADASGEINLSFGGASISTKYGDVYTAFPFILPPGQYPSGSLTLTILSGSLESRLSLPAVTVPRADGQNFDVADVAISGMTVPGFDIIDGYLE